MLKLVIFVVTFTFINCQLFPNRRQLAAEDISLADRTFRVVYEWRTINFAYRNENDRARARQIGEFIDQNILISDVKAFANRLYVTMPRMLNGVPATLGWIVSPDDNGRKDPLVEPFPSWEYNKEGDCGAMQFVQGIAIDGTGLMWVVDSGRSQTLQNRPTISCVPKLLIMDLKRNGTVIHIYEFPEEVVARGKNYLNKIVVDDAYGGFAYITDNSGSDPGIVVFSRKLNRSWKVRENNSMRAALNAVEFSINGTSLRFSIHIDGIALGPYFNPNTGDTAITANNAPKLINESFERNVYYSPLSSYHLYSIPASILRNPDFTTSSNPLQIIETITDYGLKTSQTDGMIMDNRGILYFGLLKEHAIAQWDSFEPFTQNNQKIVALDENFIQWVDGMTFDENGNLFAVVNRLYNFVAGRLNPNEVNFRILKAKVGGQSYVITNSPGAGNIGLDAIGNIGLDAIGPRDELLLDNGISIQNTTPLYSYSLDAGREYPDRYNYYNNDYRSSSQLLIGYLNIIFVFIIGRFFC